MKKFNLYLLFIMFFCFYFSIDCYALPKTFNRGVDNNFLVPKDVVVDFNNYNIVMNTPAIDSSEKIYDFADLLSQSDIDKVYKELNNFSDKSGFDSIIVTTKSLNGMNIGDFSYNFYDYNDFKDNGIIFVIYIGDYEPEIYMGVIGKPDSKISKIFSTKVVDQILPYVYENVSSKEYSRSIIDYCNITSDFYDGINSGKKNEYILTKDGKVIVDVDWINIVIISFCLTSVITVYLVFNSRKRNVYVLDDDLSKNINESTLIVKCNADNFLDSSYSKVKQYFKKSFIYCIIYFINILDRRLLWV